jgi:hypothetical protein
MYEMLLGLFAVILILSVAGMIKYGFNIIFLYILLFSAVMVIWAVAAIREEKRESKDGGR